MQLLISRLIATILICIIQSESRAQTVSDADGNFYSTVTIGTQIWMAENLRTTRFRNGSAIPLVTDGTKWCNLVTPGYCWYDNDPASNKNSYGALYNWFAINTGNLCPNGWHVPSDEEWTKLTNYLGVKVAGGKLKETGSGHWFLPNTNATNETGFNALAGGSRNDITNYASIPIDSEERKCVFDFKGRYGYWWSSSPSSFTNFAKYRVISYYVGSIGGKDELKRNGLSVRCIKND
jgi:uncharacterized protein (TIGR02145 family)